jgi:hypothetical protein
MKVWTKKELDVSCGTLSLDIQSDNPEEIAFLMEAESVSVTINVPSSRKRMHCYTTRLGKSPISKPYEPSAEEIVELLG